MKSSINEFLKIEELKHNLLTIAESKFELIKLEWLDKLENMLTKLIFYFLVALFVFILFLMLNLLIAVVINHLTHTFWIGYAALLIVYGGFYAVFHFNKATVFEKINRKVAHFIEKQNL